MEGALEGKTESKVKDKAKGKNRRWEQQGMDFFLSSYISSDGMRLIRSRAWREGRKKDWRDG